MAQQKKVRKQSWQSRAAAGGAGRRSRRKRQARRARGVARFGLANSAYRVPEEHLIDLAEDIDRLSHLPHEAEPDVDQVKAMVSRLEEDDRYVAIRKALRAVEAYAPAGRWDEARELGIEIFNVAWDRSQEYHVGRDAFIRRVRGKDFKPLPHAHPLTSDRAAALARIMQADESELEGVGGGPRRASELVIELSGDFEVIRLSKE